MTKKFRNSSKFYFYLRFTPYFYGGAVPPDKWVTTNLVGPTCPNFRVFHHGKKVMETSTIHTPKHGKIDDYPQTLVFYSHY
jgi:hypothetical protein